VNPVYNSRLCFPVYTPIYNDKVVVRCGRKTEELLIHLLQMSQNTHHNSTISIFQNLWSQRGKWEQLGLTYMAFIQMIDLRQAKGGINRVLAFSDVFLFPCNWYHMITHKCIRLSQILKKSQNKTTSSCGLMSMISWIVMRPKDVIYALLLISVGISHSQYMPSTNRIHSLIHGRRYLLSQWKGTFPQIWDRRLIYLSILLSTILFLNQRD